MSRVGREREGKEMTTKLFTIYDIATRIRVMATMMKSDITVEQERLDSTGFGKEFPLVVLTKLDGLKSSYDRFAWNDKTLEYAHAVIRDNWDKLTTGDSIDVEWLRQRDNGIVDTLPRYEGNE
jgi:hypothetical protein